ncbi:MAG TPA: glycosyltransferase family 4 protein [Dehalococcoidia bacterium]|nr:glycosyltransferase family 4 protein [Dehalococcoidia bacterium]
MKIVLVSPYDWAVPGGVNSHVSHLARQFLAAGHQVRIVAPSSRPRSHGCDYLEVIGEHVIGLPASGSVAHVCLSFDLATRVNKLLAREGFDIVHLHEPFMPLLPLQFLRFSKATNVATFHATREGGSRLYAYARFLVQPWWRRLDGRIAVSRVALRLIGRYFPGRYRLLPNGIDYRFFAAETPPIPAFADGKRNILFLGRQEKRKGLPYLLQAYAQMKAAQPDIRLIVVGPDGGMRAACQRYVERQGLEDVVFTGYVPYEDLPRYYQTAHAFCAPNTGQESFGIVLLEAMAAGTPIVASRLEGFAEVVTDGEEGFLVPPRDSESLASVLNRLLSDADLRRAMGQRGSLRAQEYSWDRVSQQILAYYEQVAGEPAGPSDG